MGGAPNQAQLSRSDKDETRPSKDPGKQERDRGYMHGADGLNLTRAELGPTRLGRRQGARERDRGSGFVRASGRKSSRPWWPYRGHSFSPRPCSVGAACWFVMSCLPACTSHVTSLARGGHGKAADQVAIAGSSELASTCGLGARGRIVGLVLPCQSRTMGGSRFAKFSSSG